MTDRAPRAACLLLLALGTGTPALAEDVGETSPSAVEPRQFAEAEAVEMPVLEIIGKADRKQTLPGSAQVIDAETLQASRVMTTNEALRKAAGVNVRDEEGFGLRPNVGIRGLNPTRSTKVLLLEDGIPLTYAPYGDNASYYHPPVERFDRIEILKGAAQNAYGPQTVGGTINYITPAPPSALSGGLGLTAGNRDYFNAHGFIGGAGQLLDYVRKQGDGARDNTHSQLDDVNYKAVLSAGAAHRFTARANYYGEDSQVSYSGLTDAEYANFGPRYNPFKNDFFNADRQGVSFTHELTLGAGSTLTTNLYGSRFDRHWWRQSSTTTDTQCNATTYTTNVGPGRTFQQARSDGFAVNSDDCNSAQGRLREYYTYGLEPRLRVAHGLGELEAGVRAHFEEQDRIQKNGAAPTARDGAVSEDNERLTDAYSGFIQNRFVFGALSVTPGVRIEHVLNERINRLSGARGKDELTEVLPSLGATYEFDPAAVAFVGAHRGFSPPRTEDLISGAGGSVDIDAEESWNAEVGLRGKPLAGLGYEATVFRNDFHRQVSVGSIAGGGVPLATGKALYAGLELQGRADFGRMVDSEHNPFLAFAWTYLPTADQETAFRRVDTGATLTGSAAGKRVPYAPEQLFTTTVGYEHVMGFTASLESVYVGSQYADFGNAVAPDGTGQFGEIASYTIWNAAVNYKLPGRGVGVFVTAKNLFDKVYIADRTRGILPGAPRLVQAGVEYSF